VIWYLNGTTFRTGVLTSTMGPVDTSFKVVGVADINGDGKVDLIFQHAGTGSLAVWFMNGANIISGTGFSPGGSSDMAWKIVAVR
jgi:hypothetical protein